MQNAVTLLELIKSGESTDFQLTGSTPLSRMRVSGLGGGEFARTSDLRENSGVQITYLLATACVPGAAQPPLPGRRVLDG